MSNIIIYTTTYCPYCVKAKKLLDQKKVQYKEIDLTHDDQGRLDLVVRSNGRKTVPQIFINNNHVGGYDDLYALEADRKLDILIEQNS